MSYQSYIEEILHCNSNYQILLKRGLLPVLEKLTSFLHSEYSNISLGQRLWHVKNSKLYIHKCKCGANAKFSKSKGYVCCSIECSRSLIISSNKTTFLENAEDITRRTKETNIRLYGVDNHAQLEESKIRTSSKLKAIHANPTKHKEIQDKISATNLKKYGQISSFQNEAVRLKYRTNLIDKYGVDNPIKIKEVQKKIKTSCLKKYGVEHYVESVQHVNNMELWHVENFINNLPNGYEYVGKNGLMWVVEHGECGGNFSISQNLLSLRKSRSHVICLMCNPLEEYRSEGENQIFEFIRSIYGGKIIANSRGIINPYEVDLFLPEKNLAIEYNGLYWHSDKPKNYHKNKSKMCDVIGIKLLHIFEDDWIYKQQIIKSILSGYLGVQSTIFARKTMIRQLATPVAKAFTDVNHIQGHVNASVYYGLYFGDELVLLMSFKKSSAGYEIMRLCSKLNTSIIGGANKIFKHFLLTNVVNSVYSYCDIGMFTGKVYEKLDMKLIGISEPQYWYVAPGENIRLNRQKFQKRKLVKLGYDDHMTEFQIMDKLGYKIIFGCGNAKYALNIL